VRLIYFADIRLPLERANGIQTMETCHALAVRGHDVRLIARADTHKPPRDPYEYYGLPRHPLFAIELAPVTGPQFARRIGYLSFALGRAMGKARADLLFTRDLGVADMLARVATALRPPLVYESHGYAPEVAAELPNLIATGKPASPRKLKRLASREALVWRETAGYVTITRALADLLIERFGPHRNLAVVPDGVRLAADRAWTPVPDGAAPLVAYAGHLYSWKGVDVFLDALALVPSVRGLVVGGHEEEPDLPRLRDKARDLGIAGRVEFAGLQRPTAVPSALTRATILVLPNLRTAISTRFTSPLKLFEYLAAGRAILAADLPAIREVLRDGENALLVEPGNAQALADAIARVAADPAAASRLGRAAFESAAQYGWDRRAAQLEALLERAAHG
jgi:glycosyltransferase involved in cell wall biosynthesis